MPRPRSDRPDALEHDLATAADATNAVLRELAAAGCPLVEVHEPAVTSLGPDPLMRRRFVDAQRRVLDGVDGLHVSLAITGGSAEDAGIDTLLGAPYSSLALDLVRGPDNWRIAAAAPRSIGIVCGALTADAGGDEAVEILLYALNYAASTAGRGPDRVGVATAGSLAGVPWEVAERRMRRLGEAVRLASRAPTNGPPPSTRARSASGARPSAGRASGARRVGRAGAHDGRHRGRCYPPPAIIRGRGPNDSHHTPAQPGRCCRACHRRMWRIRFDHGAERGARGVGGAGVRSPTGLRGAAERGSGLRPGGGTGHQRRGRGAR